MFDLRELERAHEIVGAAVPPTPAHAWPLLAERLGTHVVVKHENHTPAGAFKVRGGLVYLDRLKRERPNVSGIISATTGNHGQSLAFAARRHGVPAVIYVPKGNSVEKNRAMRAFGAELVEHGEDFQTAREEAVRRAQFAGLHMVPSFHPDLVLGVATYALELFRTAPDLDVLYVPIGLGSGVCGALAARDALGLRTEIVGVVAAGAPAIARSLEAGYIVEAPASTFADGMACRRPNDDAFAHLASAVRASHERWDGDGYPDGIAGEDIPLAARIISACDTYDAIVTERPYRPARSSAEALAELERVAGSQLDERVVEALVQELRVP